MFIFERYPAGRDAFVNGYRQHGDAADLEARVHLAMGRELVWGIPFFHLWNDLGALELYRTRLVRWLDGAG